MRSSDRCPGGLAYCSTSSVLPPSGGTPLRSGRGSRSAVGCGCSRRARQTAVGVVDVILKPGLAIPPEKEVRLVGHLRPYESWLITPPYLTRLTMVRSTFWLEHNRTLTRPARSYFPGGWFT